MMKYLTILIMLSGLSSYAQKTIAVTDSTDKRYVAYQDSLKKWRRNENIKRIEIAKLDAADDLDEYEAVSAKLGYSNTDYPTTNDRKFMWDGPGKRYIYYELLTCFHATIGDLCCIYKPIVLKPKQKVEYIPRHYTIVSILINAKGDTVKNVTTTTLIK
jgi:hypothetical protein